MRKILGDKANKMCNAFTFKLQKSLVLKKTTKWRDTLLLVERFTIVMLSILPVLKL